MSNFAAITYKNFTLMKIPRSKSTKNAHAVARPMALLMALLCMLAANATVSVGSTIYIKTDGTVTTTAPSYDSSRLFDCKVLTYDEANSTGTVSIELYKLILVPELVKAKPM